MRLPQPQQIVVEREPGDLVERGERLVEQQQFGFGDQGAGDRHPHPHAARELVRIGALEPGEPDRAQRRRRAVALGRAHPSGDAERQFDVGGDRAPRHQRRVLEDKPDPPRRGSCAALAADIDYARAVARLGEAGDDAQQCALAAARWPEQAEELARRHRQIDAAQRLKPGRKAFCNVADADDRDFTRLWRSASAHQADRPEHRLRVRSSEPGPKCTLSMQQLCRPCESRDPSCRRRNGCSVGPCFRRDDRKGTSVVA